MSVLLLFLVLSLQGAESTKVSSIDESLRGVWVMHGYARDKEFKTVTPPYDLCEVSATSIVFLGGTRTPIRLIAGTKSVDKKSKVTVFSYGFFNDRIYQVIDKEGAFLRNEHGFLRDKEGKKIRLYVVVASTGVEETRKIAHLAVSVRK